MMLYVGIGVVVIGLACVRPAKRSMQVVRTIHNVNAKELFETLLEPETFYKFNKLGDGVHKDYTPKITFRDKQNIHYSLTHVTPYKTIVTDCFRTHIDDEQLTFRENFSTMGTTFKFWYQFNKQDENAIVDLKIETSGPWFMVWATRRAQRDFNWKFDLVDKHIKDILKKGD